MVRQALLENAFVLAIWLLEVLAILLIARKARSEFSKGKDEADTDIIAACLIVGCGLFTVAVFQAIGGGPETLSGLLNPQYAAAREFVEALK